MNQSLVHPDLNPKKIPKITIRPWNILLFRWLGKFLLPKAKRPQNVESTMVLADGHEFRIHRPVDTPAPATLFWIHGGGLVIGSPAQEDAICMQFVEALGITVVAIKYRLAPQHQFPIPLDDCMTAWKTVQATAVEWGLNRERMVIGGASAGGGLAASLVQRIRDEGGIQPVAQLLIYPMLDDRTTTRTDYGLKEHFPWNQRSNITGWEAYLGKQRGGQSLPRYAAAARTKDLTNLPPAWIGVGTLDILHDEGVVYANRLMEAGVPTTLDVVEGGYHGFHVVDPETAVSRDYVASQVRFLRPFLTEDG